MTAIGQLSTAMLNELTNAWGEAFFVFDLDRFVARLEAFRGSFRALYPETELAYSYKTNYAPRLVKAVDEWGGLAEVVSEMELDLALGIGVEPGRIIYNGPAKTLRSIRDAMELGVVINVDSPAQLEDLVTLSHGVERDVIPIGIRIGFALGDSDPSRFGIDGESADQLGATIARIDGSSRLQLVGVHSHIARRTRSAEGYRQLTQRLLDIVDHYEIDVDFVDVGGGFFSSMPPELADQFGFTPPSPEEYAEAIAPLLADRFPGGSGPRLIIEPGVGVVGDAGWFVCRVLDVRTIGPMTIAQTTGSIHNIKPTLNRFNLPVRVISSGESRAMMAHSVDLVGYTCMEHDVLYRGYEGPIGSGDFAVFSNAGAYTNVLGPSFIRGRPAIVGWTQRGGFELIKRAEDLDDVLSTYQR